MANNYEGVSTEELKRMAEERRQRDAAIAELNRPAEPPVDRIQQMRENEASRREAWHQSNMDARARRLEGVAAEEGGRYNPQQQAAAVKWLNDNGYGAGAEQRRQFDEAQKTARQASSDKAAGDVARAQAEVERGRIAAEQAERTSMSRYGWFDESGTYHAGSNVEGKRIAGATAIQKQKISEEGKDRRSENEQKTRRDTTTMQIDANKEIAEKRVAGIEEREKQRAAEREQRDFDAYNAKMLDPKNLSANIAQKNAWKAMTPEQRRARWRVDTGRVKEGDRKQFAEGWATFKGGRWVPDAQ